MSNRRRHVPCTRCGVPVEYDKRRQPPFCRDCSDVDRALVRAWRRGHNHHPEKMTA